MEDLSWVRQYRKEMDSKIFASPEGYKIWSWIKMKAHHSDAPHYFEMRTGKGNTTVKVFRGQFIFGRKVAAKELRMTEKVVRTWIQKLASPEYDMILVQPNTHFSIIEIKNWKRYQVDIPTKRANQRPTKGQPKATDKNVDNDNNVKTELETKDLSTKEGNSGWAYSPDLSDSEKDFEIESSFDLNDNTK